MLFDKLYNLLEPQVPVPDLVLYLVADLDTCMSRIKKRNRSFEKEISVDYMRELIDAYNHYYHYYNYYYRYWYYYYYYYYCYYYYYYHYYYDYYYWYY